ncbi:MAG: ABC transporter ATP-binding protein [Methylococcaceae bacterium]|nr:ABC transporter ATP-binding protein [Methylococcaceae bacterium]
MQSDFAIELTRVSKSYREAGRDQIIFRDLSVRIRHGELLVLLGRSGSGKSTLLNLISGIDSPSSGDIAIGGLNLTLLPERDRTLYRRKHMGFVFQAYNLIPTLTVRENLLLPLELNRFPRESYARKIDSLLQEVGLENRAEEFPDRLSGGEQQRVAVARALVHEPEIILADEPTGNLDRATAHAIGTLLLELAARHNAMLIAVTHSVELAARFPRRAELVDGRLTNEDRR